MWAQHVRVSAKGGFISSKGVASILGSTLYSAMEYSFLQVIDRSLNSGALNFVNEDGTLLSYVQQRKSLERLLSITASDWATEGVRRHLEMS